MEDDCIYIIAICKWLLFRDNKLTNVNGIGNSIQYSVFRRVLSGGTNPSTINIQSSTLLILPHFPDRKVQILLHPVVFMYFQAKSVSRNKRQLHVPGTGDLMHSVRNVD